MSNQSKGINTFQRYLSVWVLLCMAIGVLIGHFKTIKTVVLLPNKLNAGERSTVDLDMSELDVTAAESKAAQG
jgi:ACR3 family arsenite efflux pump ArsB